MYKGKVRVRVCGVLIQNGEVLLLKHDGFGPAGYLWSFPGGGVEFQEDVKSCLEREFIEETGLIVKAGQFLLVNEYVKDDLHAIELFFKVEEIGGQLNLGSDPEMEQQILSDIRFFSDLELAKLHADNKHNIFLEIDRVEDMTKLSGYYKFGQLRK